MIAPEGCLPRSWSTSGC